MMRNVLGYFLCAVIAAGSYATGQIHVFRDCCEKSIVFNHLDLKGCANSQEEDRLTRECCAPLMSHTLALTGETTQVSDAKQHAAVDEQSALPNFPSLLDLITVENSPGYETIPPRNDQPLLYQQLSRLLI